MKRLIERVVDRINRTIDIDGRKVPHIHGGAGSSQAQIGAGVSLSYWNTAASPDAWALLGNVRSIQGVGTKKPEVDSTTLDSTAVERIGGLPDGQEVSITVTTTATAMTLFEGWIAGTSNIDLKLIFPTPATSTRYFTIAPLGFDHGTIQPSGLCEIVVTGRISGAISSTPSHP